MAVASRHLCRAILRTRPIQRRHVNVTQTQSCLALRHFTSTIRNSKDEDTTPTLSDLVDQAEKSQPRSKSKSQAESSSTSEDIAPSTTTEDVATDPLAALEASKSTSSETGHKFAEYMTPEGIAELEKLPSGLREKLESELQPYFDHVRRSPPDVWANQADAAPYDEEIDIDEFFARNDVEEEFDDEEARGIKNGYWADEEPDEAFTVPDDDDTWHEENITTPAEADLEVHREVRQYTRRAAWDLPGLLKYARPFVLPDMTKTPLRFRYTTYMGEDHPAQHKVVLQFNIGEVATCAGLTDLQRSKFVKLLGTRYNPDHDMAHMSCEKFQGQAQNKRYLGDTLQKLLEESKTGDMFEDVPFDFRHVKRKVVHEFPEGWKLSGEGAQKLVEARNETRMLGRDAPVNGRNVLETAHVPVPVYLPARRDYG